MWLGALPGHVLPPHQPRHIGSNCCLVLSRLQSKYMKDSLSVSDVEEGGTTSFSPAAGAAASLAQTIDRVQASLASAEPREGRNQFTYAPPSPCVVFQEGRRARLLVCVGLAVVVLLPCCCRGGQGDHGEGRAHMERYGGT